MNADKSLAERWSAIANPGSELTEAAFNHFLQTADPHRHVLNCAIPLTRARSLTDFQLPRGVTAADCIRASATGQFPPALRDWKYQPRIRSEPQLASMSDLPAAHQNLAGLPWFDSPAQSTHLGINARHVRYHHKLWHELRPKTLQGVNTTLVLAMPQIGFSLTPHTQLEKSFLFLGALARGLGPTQLFPARYLYPDAQLGTLAEAPAPIFADVLPTVGGFAYPVVDCEPDTWRMLARFGNIDRYHGYPFLKAVDASRDFTLQNHHQAPMLLPNGRRVSARLSQSHVRATHDPGLREQLLLDRDAFERNTCLVRGTVTHDGLPFQLPVEMQCLVFAVILTHWRLELDTPGDLSSYAVFTEQAAIRGYQYFHRVEPHFSHFMKMVTTVSADPHFKSFPLSTHLTHSWLGGNVCLSNQHSDSERDLGPEQMRAYYHQQLDWQLAVTNLMNHTSFRKRPGEIRSRTGAEVERELSPGGLAFHQMQRLLRFDSHLFPRGKVRASYWPEYHPAFAELDQRFLTEALPRL